MRIVRFGSRPQIDRLSHEIALLQEELRIKDARIERVPPHRRPHYVPLERMAIQELRAARGWSALQAAERFHVTATTLGSWKARIDERGPNALLRISVPVNKFPDLVRYIVRRLKLLCPRLGKVKIADMLCRAGLHLAPTTVGRFLRADLRWPEPVAVGYEWRRTNLREVGFVVTTMLRDRLSVISAISVSPRRQHVLARVR